MVALIDRISPTFLGDSRIRVSINPCCEPLMAFRPITVDLNYDDAEPEGVVLPLEITVQPAFAEVSAAGGYRHKVFHRHVPSSYTFTVPSAGDYLILIREYAHNQWQGRLVITVAGNRLSTEHSRTRRTA
ncbi:MAG: hypothetical protein GY854_02165 [Deltaproteobacteria bacterium]|nr:hypothetical protein [Deltaproteobacteria bacterium]